MTRINAYIKPAHLTDAHLVAEYKEILQLAGQYARRSEKAVIPAEFSLGKGHVSFFYDKAKYLERRHKLVGDEMELRGFVPTKFFNLFWFDPKHRNDWTPTKKAGDEVARRIRLRLTQQKLEPRYYKKVIHRASALVMLDRYIIKPF